MKTKQLFVATLCVVSVILGSCEKKSDDVTPNSNSPENTEKIAGILSGQFSIGENRKIQFSQGNLQYLGETKTWRFADHQYDYLGIANKNISEGYIDWIDLFGWGTGNNPSNASAASENYSAFTDWGVNKISNGGNEENLWRTLSRAEWQYLCFTRLNADKLFGLGRVNEINGVILLPDTWKLPSGVAFLAGTSVGMDKSENAYFDHNKDNHFYDNTYTTEEWSVMEKAGAVFLPAAGERDKKAVRYLNQNGYYWTSTPGSNDNYASEIYFDYYYFYTTNGIWRSSGQSVRLVHDVK